MSTTSCPRFKRPTKKTKRLQLRLLRHAVENAPRPTSPKSSMRSSTSLWRNDRNLPIFSTEPRFRTSSVTQERSSRTAWSFSRASKPLCSTTSLSTRSEERTQLHRVVAENAWMFGEQYHLSVDDQSLTEVLKKHITAKGREVEIDEPVTRADGSRGIIDLMFSRNIQLAGSEDREHLVVELKRPDVKIDAEVSAQIESYAFAVADDERFRAVPAKWVFWAVSSDVDRVVARKVSQRSHTQGILFQDEEQRITIWVKTWSQIINDCKARLRFFAEKLNYAPDRNSSLAHLKTTYHKYLADLFAPKIEANEAAKADEESVSP